MIKEKVMKYPVYIDGKRCGELECSCSGLLTVFRARVGTRTRHPVRLYVYGAGKNALLGTLIPDDSGMSLERKFTRSELKNVPETIEYAADKPLLQQKDDADRIWQKASRGCLISETELAIPADPIRLVRVKDRLRTIEGKVYLIFERKM